jgi:hypothetical protein
MPEKELRREHHAREYVVGGIGALAEYLAVKYSISALAWFAALLFFFAVHDFVNHHLTGFRALKWVIYSCVAIFLVLGTLWITKGESIFSKGADATPHPVPPAPTHPPPSPSVVHVTGFRWETLSLNAELSIGLINEGPNGVVAQNYAYTKVIPDCQSVEERDKLEEVIWKEATSVAIPKLPKLRLPIKVPVKAIAKVRFEKQEVLDSFLRNDQKTIVFVAGQTIVFDAAGRHPYPFCVSMTGNGVKVLCQNHNGP